jgi:hypothetical protein
MEAVMTSLESEYRGISTEWKFSKTSGWYTTCDKGKNRLFYLLPVDGGFVFKMVFNERCLGQIRKGAFPRFILEMIRNARKYSEGTLLEFDASNFNTAAVLNLLRIKTKN